jgi:hypothetical protein
MAGNKGSKKRRKQEIYPLLLFTIIILYLALIMIKIPIYSHIGWDSAVYIEIGKYLLSNANSGVWEPSRPLIWPIILGLSWGAGQDPILYGKIITYLMSGAILLLVYLIGKDVFDKRTGLIASALLAFTPTFFLANSQLLSEIPSTFFAVLGVYLFVRKKYFYTGLIIGIAFMTRFLQLYTLIILLAFIAIDYYKNRKQLIKNIFLAVAGFSVFTIPYLILNMMLYHNPLYPFILQIYMARYTGWLWWEGIGFYFVNIFWENYLAILSLIGLIYIIKSRQRKQLMILSILLIYFIFYNSIAHKEMRFMINLLPYLFIIAAYGIVKLAEKIKDKRIKTSAIMLLLLIFMVLAWPQYKIWGFSSDYNPYYEYLNSVEDGRGIWTTNPLYIMETNKRAELVYYPTFDTKQAKEMQIRILEAKHILFNECDIPCPPWDKTCPEEKQNFIDLIKENFDESYYKKNEDCSYFIFTVKA